MSAGEIAGWLMAGYLVFGMCLLILLARSDSAASGQRRSYLGAWVIPLGNDRLLVAAGLGVATVVHLPAAPPPASAPQPRADVRNSDDPAPAALSPTDDLAALELLWSISPATEVEYHRPGDVIPRDGHIRADSNARPATGQSWAGQRT